MKAPTEKSAENQKLINDCILIHMLCFFQAETRAEFAERSVAKLEKTIDDLEGNKHFFLGSQLPTHILTATMILLTLLA